MTQEEALEGALKDMRGVRAWLQAKWHYAIWLIAIAEWLELMK